MCSLVSALKAHPARSGGNDGGARTVAGAHLHAPRQTRRGRSKNISGGPSSIRANRRTITLDDSAASHRAVREMKEDGVLPEDTRVRSSKHLNNLGEQDHRKFTSRTNVIPSFRQFRNAAITLAGVELMHRIRKGQFSLTQRRLKDVTVPAVLPAQ